MTENSNKISENLIQGEGLKVHFHLDRSHSALIKYDIRSIGYNERETGSIVPRRKINWHLLLQLQSGKIICEAGGRTLELNPGEILIVPAAVIRTVRVVEQAIWNCYHLWDTKRYEKIHQGGPRIEKIAVLDEIGGDLTHLRSEQDSRLIALYHEMIAIKISRHFSEESPYQLQRLDQLWQKVRKDPLAPWTTPQLATEAGISRSHFHRLCKEIYQYSPMELLSCIRLELGAALLLETEDKLDVIACCCGFASAAAFSQAFLRKYELRPGAFRKEKYR